MLNSTKNDSDNLIETIFNTLKSNHETQHIDEESPISIRLSSNNENSQTPTKRYCNQFNYNFQSINFLFRCRRTSFGNDLRKKSIKKT